MSNDISIDLGFDLDSILGKGNRSKTSFHYLAEGTQVYKILPALDPNNRQLAAEHNFHWAKDSSDKSIKVACVYYTEKYCPFCNAHNALFKEYKAAEANQDKDSPLLKKINSAMQKVSKTKQFYYNAVTPNNEIVVLQLTKTVSDLLNKKLVEAITEKNQDPTAMNAGYWFKFTKVGKGRDSVTVDFHRTSKIVEGEEVEVLNRTPLPKELIETAATRVAKIFDKKAMWIKEYSGAELNDYLNGVPLKDKYKEQQLAAKANGTDISFQSDASPEAEEPTSEEASASSEQTTASSKQTSDEPAPTSAADAFAAEAARLRNLAAGKK